MRMYSGQALIGPFAIDVRVNEWILLDLGEHYDLLPHPSSNDPDIMGPDITTQLPLSSATKSQ